MMDMPEHPEITDDGSLFGVCNRVCVSLKPSGSRERDEVWIFERLCLVFAERGHKNVSFTPSENSSKINDLKEHLFLLIDDQEKSDAVVEHVYEFLDNVYPQEELWRLKMRNYDG